MTFPEAGNDILLILKPTALFLLILTHGDAILPLLETGDNISVQLSN